MTEEIDQNDQKRSFEAHTSLQSWQKLVPYLFVGFLVLFLYLQPEHFSSAGQNFAPHYLTFLTFICGAILAGALIGFCRQVPNIFLLSLAHIFAGHALLQLQLVVWEFVVPPRTLAANTEQLYFLILPLFMASNLFLLSLLERFDLGDGNRTQEQLVYGAFGSSILIFSIFLHLAFGTPNINISSQLVFTGSLISVILSFLALLIFPFRGANDLFSLRYWTVFLILGNLAVYLTPTELLSGLTQLNNVEIEFTRSGVFLTLIGGLIFHSVSIILTEQRRTEHHLSQRAAIDLALTGAQLINKSESFESGAKSFVNLVAEKERYAVAHLTLLTTDEMSHYWKMDDPKLYQKFRSHSEKNEMEFGEGFLGTLWEEQRHGTINNLSKTKKIDYRRKEAAETAGLVSVYAVPIFMGSRLIAMMEFFKTTPSQPETAIISTINSIRHQLANLYQRQVRDQKISEREGLHQEVVDRFPLAMAIFNKEEQVVFNNSQFKQLRQQCCGDVEDDFDFTDMITSAAYGEHLLSASEDPQKWIDEVSSCFATPGSYMIWHLTSGMYLEFSCKRMLGGRTLCLWSDVSAQQELATYNHQISGSLNALLNTLPCGVCVFGKDLRVKDFNTKFISMLELSTEDIQQGISFSSFLKLFKERQYQYAEFLSEMALLRIKMAESKEPYHNGQMLFCQQTYNLFAAPTEDEGFTLTLMDMSDTESYQLELREAKRRAEGNAEKAMELARTAQNSNKVKTEFLTLIDRELRIPLNSISTASELLRETKISEQQSKHLKIIKSATEDLSNLMVDMQDLANLEAQNLTLISQPVHLVNLLDKLSTQWSFLAKTKSLNFKIEADPDIPPVFYMDGRRLEQIINNLVDNALKFTRSGEIVVALRADQKSDKLNIAVSDTGIGISKSQQKTLFQSLDEAMKVKDRRRDSHGLGLTLCHDLVELMGGTISVSSAPGEGSTFSFDVSYTLPDPSDEIDSAENIVPLKDDIWPPTSPTMTILVAEDHPVNQVVIQELLGKWGHKVEIVENGELAVAAVATCKFDLVIMDIHMPVMDGLEACKEIRAFPGRIKDIPIIALTANSMSGERQRCLKAGMNDYLTKPVHKWELKDTLITYSNMKRVGEDIWKQKVATLPDPSSAGEDQKLGTKILDHQIFQEFIENFGLPVVRKLADKLVGQYEINHSNIMDMLQQGEWEGIGKEAHMIKSGFGQFGLMRAAAFATQMDIDARRRDKQSVLENAVALLNLCDQAILQLKQELEALQTQ